MHRQSTLKSDGKKGETPKKVKVVTTAREHNTVSTLSSTLEKTGQQWPEMAEANLRV